MGDGHLFVFREALEAVLAAIRVQKALRRYNRFQPERQRVQIRIGIHWAASVDSPPSRSGVEAFETAVSQTFQRLRAISRKGARSGEEAAIDQEFEQSWESLEPLLAAIGRLDEKRKPEGEKKA